METLIEKPSWMEEIEITFKKCMKQGNFLCQKIADQNLPIAYLLELTEIMSVGSIAARVLHRVEKSEELLKHLELNLNSENTRLRRTVRHLMQCHYPEMLSFEQLTEFYSKLSYEEGKNISEHLLVDMYPEKINFEMMKELYGSYDEDLKEKVIGLINNSSSNLTTKENLISEMKKRFSDCHHLVFLLLKKHYPETLTTKTLLELIKIAPDKTIDEVGDTLIELDRNLVSLTELINAYNDAGYSVKCKISEVIQATHLNHMSFDQLQELHQNGNSEIRDLIEDTMSENFLEHYQKKIGDEFIARHFN